MAQWEWIIMLVIAVGFLVAELISVRRAIRRAREAEGLSPHAAVRPGGGVAAPGGDGAGPHDR